jgi:predicted transcriptional regulator
MDAAERVDLIFKALESEKPLTLTNLAKRSGMHYWTIQKYVNLILDIQNRPRLEKIESESTVVLVRLKKD